eukprot:symbB.v1.2.030635.t1/scaffold3476.1/size55973/2
MLGPNARWRFHVTKHRDRGLGKGRDFLPPEGGANTAISKGAVGGTNCRGRGCQCQPSKFMGSPVSSFHSIGCWIEHILTET